jgi:hypothetical protein
MADLTPNTTRADQLTTLSNQVGQSITGQAQAGQAQRVTGLQQAVQQATQAGAKPTASQLQSMGGQQTAQAGEIGLSAAQTGQTRETQIGAMGLQEQFMADQQALSQKKLSVQAQSQKNTDTLSSINVQVKQELIDKQNQFASDAMGRTIFNDRQLADLAIFKAQSQNDLDQYEQNVHEQTQKRMAMLQQAQKVIQDTMQNGAASWNQTMNQDLQKQLAQQAYNLQQKLTAAQNRANSNAAIFSGAGMVIGAVVGGVLTGGAGAMAGASIGAGVGGLVYGQTTGKQDQNAISNIKTQQGVQ